MYIESMNRDPLALLIDGGINELPPQLRRKITIVGQCWEWEGAKNWGGYGLVHFNNKQQSSHRLVYTLLKGSIPDGLTIDHLCRNRSCCNPAHLDPVPIRVNTLRGQNIVAKNAVKTHCVLGHPYDEANTYRQKLPRHGRVCRACHRLKQAVINRANAVRKKGAN